MKRLTGFSSESSYFEMPFLICDVTSTLDKITHVSMKSQFRFNAMLTVELYRVRHKKYQSTCSLSLHSIVFPMMILHTVSPEQSKQHAALKYYDF